MGSAKATAVDFEAARARLAASRGFTFDNTPRPPKTSPPARTFDLKRADKRLAAQRGTPKGSRLPADVQAWVKAELANGASLNGLANALEVSRDAIRVVRDGTSVRSARYHERRKATDAGRDEP